MMHYFEVIDKLKYLNDNDVPGRKEQVQHLVDSIFPLKWLHHPLKAGTVITRCRRDAPNLKQESFGCKKAKDVKDFQRASIPHESVFYGSVGDNGVEDGDMIALLETSKLHRNNIEKGREQIAVSHWLVTKDIDMALICHNRVFSGAISGSTLNAMQFNYQRKLPEYDKNVNVIREFDILAEFVSSQFAKRIQEGDNAQYMISAFFAHNSLSTEPGIIYPSTQVDGKLGFNVVLTPQTVKNNLSFCGAEWRVLYKAKAYMQLPIGKYDYKQISKRIGIDGLHELEWIK